MRKYGDKNGIFWMVPELTGKISDIFASLGVVQSCESTFIPRDSGGYFGLDTLKVCIMTTKPLQVIDWDTPIEPDQKCVLINSQTCYLIVDLKPSAKMMVETLPKNGDQTITLFISTHLRHDAQTLSLDEVVTNMTTVAEAMAETVIYRFEKS